MCKELEDFVMGICCWEKKQLGKLGKYLGKTFKVDKEYLDQEYNPSTNRLIETTIWVADNFDQAGWVDNRNLKAQITSLREYYTFLCKFIHPTPMLFEIDSCMKDINSKYSTHQDVVNASKIVYLEVFERCSILLDNLFHKDIFLNISFAEMIMCLSRSNNDLVNKKMLTIPLPFVTKFVNRYKGLIKLKGDNGIVIKEI